MPALMRSGKEKQPGSSNCPMTFSAGGKDFVVDVVPDVDVRRLDPAVGLGVAREVDDELVGGETADLAGAADARGRGDLDEARLVELADVRGDGAVGDPEALCKMGETELAVLQDLVEDADADVRIERLIDELALFEIF